MSTLRRLRLATLLFSALLLCACATTPERTSHRTPAVDEQPSAAAAAVPAQADTLAAVALAQQRVRAARQSLPDFRDADAVLRLAEQAAQAGDNPRAQSLARQAAARANYALDEQRTRAAAQELQALYATTGLSDAQLAAMRAAEAALIRGESALALGRLRALRKAAATRYKSHTVEAGETLSGIAARADVYGNSLLWPLIWQANRAALPDPHRLRAGQKLLIRPQPTVDEVVAAIKTARHFPARLRVGPVKTLAEE